LPLTGRRVVDMVITDLGVFALDKKGDAPMRLVEIARGVTEEEIRAKTDAEYKVAVAA
jgi:3-oxoacid CoA-transferase subunit B